MKTLIIFIGFVILVTLAEARQDYWICQFDSVDATQWKLWGNTVMIGWIALLSGLITLINKRWIYLLWIPILCLTWWIVHDCALGYWLTGSITYVSDHGFDGYMKAVFAGSGAVYLGVKAFVLTLLILTYNSLK